MKNIQKILGNIEDYNRQNPCWIVSPELGDFLRKKVLEINAKNVLEIGSSIGYSAMHFALGLKETAGKLYTIESHKERFEIAKKNFEESGLDEYIVQIKGHAPEVIPEIDEPWDLVFFDATKCEHVLYFNAIKDKIKKGGFLIVDNVISHAQAMKDFLEKIEKDKSFEYEILKMDKGVLLAVSVER